ncbi:phospholipase d1 [Fusarium albosuccineum]|uniref:Phospholipase d1 n=1 Tax=Fusarium albosuccineum TaxID=1237068 RepID=A0A8H4LD65_9HYPO|nr:phospholipase d1 [Fusarium albosuccineum]
MKFVWSLALLAAAGTYAQSVTDTEASAPTSSDACDAEYIVKRCLETENAKAEDCKGDDWDCLCAAYEAIATCFNNCPDDTRAADTQSQVKVYCQQASLYGTKTKATKTASAASETTASSDATATADDAEASGTATDTAASADNTNNAADLARNTGGVLLAVAGVVAAIL